MLFQHFNFSPFHKSFFVVFCFVLGRKYFNDLGRRKISNKLSFVGGKKIKIELYVTIVLKIFLSILRFIPIRLVGGEFEIP